MSLVVIFVIVIVLTNISIIIFVVVTVIVFVAPSNYPLWPDTYFAALMQLQQQ